MISLHQPESIEFAAHEDNALAAWDPLDGPGEELIELELADIEDADERAASTTGNLGGTLASVVLHVWLIATLSGITRSEPDLLEPPPLEGRVVQDAEAQPDEELEQVEYELTNPDDRELEVRKVVNAASVGLSQTKQPELREAPKPIELLATEARRPAYDIPEGLQIDESLVVKGTTGEAMVHIESALDRVTWEIARNLQERKVLVVWMLDASDSLKQQRAAVSKRLRRIYGELDALESVEQIPRLDRPLLSGVVAYGLQTAFLTDEPTDDFDTVREAFANAPSDPSGRENVFSAVEQVVDRWSKYRTQNGRRIMLIVVTDESGDDFAMHEPAIARCRRYGAKAYVIGPAAVFGRREGYVPYVAPENGQTYQLPVDLGPETAMYDLVDLPFWYDGPQLKYLSSGFAPYALARLVKETGGVYFTTNMTTMAGLTPTGVFDSGVLKPFEPDYTYGTPAEYLAELQRFPLRMSVINAARLSRQNPAEGTPQLALAVTPQNFRQVATEAQKTVARSQFMVENILSAFPQGIEKQLEREPSPRWRVTFLLSYGRLLAQRVRCLEYNYALAELKGTRAEEDIRTKSNRWRFRPAQTLNYYGGGKRYAVQAEEFLQRVIDEAPATPWAVLAAREIKDGFGIKVEERFVPPPTPRPPAAAAPANNQPRLLLAQEPRPQRQAPQPKPVPPKLPNL
ncbi:MAG: VWA domain-containing protein [Planctomycetes bacterium]|nr:VWA domain-containing protein [Planctomycetota bacterium]